MTRSSPVCVRARTTIRPRPGCSAARRGVAKASGPAKASAPAWGQVKQVRAGLLNIGYVELGPADGPVTILLHGWPYDIHSYVDVAPALAAKGHRVLIPYLRGYGPTRFLHARTVRNGRQSALASDVIAFMDALRIRKATLGGFDWGARTACITAALWPERVKALVSVSGYLIVNLTANQEPLTPQAELGWWYQYYFATERGVKGYTQNTYEFNKLIWKLASPQWNFDEATGAQSVKAWVNPEHRAQRAAGGTGGVHPRDARRESLNDASSSGKHST